MSKRFAENEGGRNGDGVNSKRQKPLQPEQVEEIFSARQLQDLLVFRQDDIERLRTGNIINVLSALDLTDLIQELPVSRSSSIIYCTATTNKNVAVNKPFSATFSMLQSQKM